MSTDTNRLSEPTTNGTQPTTQPASALVGILVRKILRDAEAEIGAVITQARQEAGLGPEWSYAIDTHQWIKKEP